VGKKVGRYSHCVIESDDGTITEKAGNFVPGVSNFYDHAEGDTVWGQDLIYAFYAENKTAYSLTLRLHEKQDL